MNTIAEIIAVFSALSMTSANWDFFDYDDTGRPRWACETVEPAKCYERVFSFVWIAR